MSSFPRIPLGDLVLDDRPRRSTASAAVWNLNLDQIESATGRVIEDVWVQPNELGPSTYPFEAGTVLYSKLRPYLNKVVVAGKPGYATTELVPLRCNTDKVLPEYLAYFLRSAEFLNFANTVVAGAKMPRMVMSEFWKYGAPLPPLPEQRRIAAILDKADALRTKRREALAQLDRLAQSIFAELMTSTTKEQAQLSIEDCTAKIIDYRGKTPEKTASGVPLVTAKVVKKGELLEPNEFIAEADYSTWMRRGLPQEGDVLFTTEAPLGEVAQLDDRKVALAQRLLLLRGKPGLLDNKYLMFALTSPEVRRQIEARATGSTVKGIRQSELRQVLLPVPPLDAQIRFNVRMAEVASARQLGRRSLRHLEQLFSVLQHRAFQEAL